jgi:hypothetical protein
MPWNGNANGVRAEVVIVDQKWRETPSPAGVLEVAHKFPLLGVDADDRLATAFELVPKITDVKELLIPIRAAACGDLLTIDAKRIAHLLQKSCHGIGAHDDAIVSQRHGYLLRCAA